MHKEIGHIRVVGERPNFGPAQIRTMQELRAGICFIHHYVQPSPYPVRCTIVEKPYQKGGRWWMLVTVYLPSGDTYQSEISLADCGVVPYKTSLGPQWNLNNWLEKIS